MEPTMIAQILGAAVYVALEYWLGKTDKTKAGSVPELLICLFKGAKSEADKTPETKP